MSNATSFHRRLKTHSTSSLKQVKKDGEGVLTQLFNPQNLASIQTIDLNQQKSNVYINTNDNQPNNRDGSSSRRRKFIIIKKKRHRDGSIESHKQLIYKNYGDNFVRQEHIRLNSQGGDYQSSPSRQAGSHFAMKSQLPQSIGPKIDIKEEKIGPKSTTLFKRKRP